MLVLVLAATGLVAGTLAWPRVSKQYYLYRLEHGDPAEQLEAMNRLAARAVRDERVARTLLDALVNEAETGDLNRRRAVDAIAVWMLERLTVPADVVDEMLDDAGEDRFELLAGWLEAAGRWNGDHRTKAHRIRREILRLGHDDKGVRLAALDALQHIGLCDRDDLGEALERLVNAHDGSVREAVVWTAAACLPAEKAKSEVLASALSDALPAVRDAAWISLSWLGPDVLERWIEQHSSEGQGGVGRTMLWSLRGTRLGTRLAIEALRDGVAPGRPMAAWALGFAGQDDAAVGELLVGLLDDGDPVVAARAAIALGRRARLVGPAAFGALLESESEELRLAGLYALGRCRFRSERG
ncbi:MAG: hypothetical protein ACE5GE_09050, partial [Phycisphaerae bacterium]